MLGGVVYELHVGTFTPEGTLDAAQRRLGHLVELGVDVVELMPRRGLARPLELGLRRSRPVGSRRRATKARRRCSGSWTPATAVGLAVCLDVVYNHLGPVGNYLSRFGPYFSDRHPTPWGPGLNLDGPGSFHVRRWVIDNALRWFADFHVDALRLDAVHELHDDSDEHLLAALSTRWRRCRRGSAGRWTSSPRATSTTRSW